MFFKKGGKVILDDFKNYRAIVKKPVTMNIDNEFRIFTQPLPSSGILVGFIIKLMKGDYGEEISLNF